MTQPDASPVPAPGMYRLVNNREIDTHELTLTASSEPRAQRLGHRGVVGGLKTFPTDWIPWRELLVPCSPFLVPSLTASSEPRAQRLGHRGVAGGLKTSPTY